TIPFRVQQRTLVARTGYGRFATITDLYLYHHREAELIREQKIHKVRQSLRLPLTALLADEAGIRLYLAGCTTALWPADPHRPTAGLAQLPSGARAAPHLSYQHLPVLPRSRPRAAGSPGAGYLYLQRYRHHGSCHGLVP